MAKKKLPNSIRKHIRKQKAQIRRKFSDVETQKKEIADLYAKFLSGAEPAEKVAEAPKKEKKAEKVPAKPKKDAQKDTTKKGKK